MMFCALIDSGLFVNEMSFVSTPLSSAPDTAIMAMNTPPQIPMTLQGCRLLARANDSGLIFMTLPHPLVRRLPRTH